MAPEGGWVECADWLGLCYHTTPGALGAGPPNHTDCVWKDGFSKESYGAVLEAEGRGRRAAEKM